MNVSVHSAVCVGSGQCYGITAKVFGADAYGRAVALIDEPDESEHAAVIEALETCPSGAIELSPEPR
jgi:ferredoxin